MRIKKLITSSLILFPLLILVACNSNSNLNRQDSESNATQAVTTKGKSVLFINASQHTNGNTARMGETLLDGIDHDTLNLINYQMNQLGQNFEGDQFNNIISAIEKADTIVIGTPIYWHTMSGSLKTFIDRLYDLQNDNALQGKKLYFFLQGSAPTEDDIAQVEFIMSRVASQTGMDLIGSASNDQEITSLHNDLIK